MTAKAMKNVETSDVKVETVNSKGETTPAGRRLRSVISRIESAIVLTEGGEESDALRTLVGVEKQITNARNEIRLSRDG